MSEPRDPLGKRALFSPSAEPSHREPASLRVEDSGSGGAGLDGTGKVALFSSAQRRAGTVVLDCASCHGRTRVSYVEFARRHLPVWLWLPWRDHSRFMTCPACERRAWISTNWLT